MLQNNSVAKFLTEKLNEKGEVQSMKFKIHADAGFYEDTGAVQGILTVLDTIRSPISEYVEQTIRYKVKFAVVDNDAGCRIKKFNEVVLAVISQLQGCAETIDLGEAIFDFGSLTTDEAQIKGSLGLTVSSSFVLKVTYSINAISSGAKVWLLDGAVIPYLEENIDLEIEGATNSVYGLNATQSLANRQTRYYRFKMPYKISHPICSKLQKDILAGDMSKIYTLSYYDGVTYTKDNQFTTTVSLFRTTNSGERRPAIANFTVVFTEADDGKTGDTYYEMALIDNPFDSGSVNVRYFENRTTQ